MSEQQYLVGIDIGGTKCAVVVGRLIDNKPTLLGRRAFATTETQAPQEVIARLVALAYELLQQHNLSLAAVAAVGVSCGGPLDNGRGIILSPPNLPRWVDVPLKAMLEERLGVPTFVQNDADACALAEWRWGAGKGYTNLVFLTFGTGMGAGLIFNGQLYSGAGGQAGEVGHVRLAPDGPIGHNKAGSFEGFCSGGGIRRLAEHEIRAAWARGETVAFCSNEDALAYLDAQVVAAAARAGDPLAQRIFATSGTYLGYGLALLIDILNPQAIIIGSIFARATDLLWPHAESMIAAEALPRAVAQCVVLPAALGDAVGDYAALAVAHDGLRRTSGS